MLPLAEQSNSMDFGLAIGDAIATPIAITNHANTRRASKDDERSNCISQLWQCDHLTQLRQLPKANNCVGAVFHLDYHRKSFAPDLG